MFPKCCIAAGLSLRHIHIHALFIWRFNHWTNNNIPGKQNKVQTLKREANRGVSDGDYVLMNDWMRRLFKKSGWLLKSFQYLQFKEEESLLLLIWRVMSRCPYFEKKHLYVEVLKFCWNISGCPDWWGFLAFTGCSKASRWRQKRTRMLFRRELIRPAKEELSMETTSR